MSYSNFMNKVHRWDNRAAKWLMRHFYFMFFQMILLIIFLFWFVNMFSVIDTNLESSGGTLVTRILASLNLNTTIVVLLLLMNSFWMLYILNALQRMQANLRDIGYNTRQQRRFNKPKNHVK